mmetsp:Transcript_90685/g.256781  ORF Transcript_90685/g.256781 Transcript_90685/m.256781 type:complete len:539 (-) Transcript_90685:1078-2694(-)
MKPNRMFVRTADAPRTKQEYWPSVPPVRVQASCDFRKVRPGGKDSPQAFSEASRMSTHNGWPGCGVSTSSYSTFRKTVPALPIGVTQPTAPSLFTRTFIRMSPEALSLVCHSRTSNASPGFSFRGDWLSPSTSMDSVSSVSFTTLNWRPPSLRNTVPALPTAETQPRTPSFSALICVRMTPDALSFTGPLMTLTTSSRSRRRRVLLSLMLSPSVMAVCLTTTRYGGITIAKASFERDVSPLGQIVANTSDRSSVSKDSVSSSAPAFFSSPSAASASSSAPSAFNGFTVFSAAAKNARKSLSSMTPSLPASSSAKSSSSLRFLICWLYLTTFSADVRTFSTSPARFLPTSSWKRSSKLMARLILPSIRPTLESCFLVSFVTNKRSSVLNSSSMSSFRPLIFCCATPTAPLASSMTELISPARDFICGTRKPLLFTDRGLISSSAFETAWSASLTASTAFLIFSCIWPFRSSSRFCLASLSARRFASRWTSRATPMATLRSWKLPSGTPLAECFTEYSVWLSQTRLRASSERPKLNSAFA